MLADMLAKFELHKKAEPYTFAVKEQWQRLKRSDPDLMSYNGKIWSGRDVLGPDGHRRS